MLLSHCSLKDIDIENEKCADKYNWYVTPFKPGKNEDAAFVDMATAIGLVNRLYFIYYLLFVFNMIN